MKECCRFKHGTCASEINPQPLGNFSKDSKRKDGLTPHCKACLKVFRRDKKEWQNNYTREWRKRNKERCKGYTKTKLAKANAKVRLHRYRLKCRYGLTTEQWNEMHKAQNYQCRICNKHMQDCVKQSLYVDHCHETNRVRGLLCSKCNTMIGQADDDVSILANAVRYLGGTI